jgi:hypothetical protein
MTYKYDENRIDAEKPRFLLKSVKSYIIGKRLLCRYCMYSVRTCSFRTSVCYAEVRSAMTENLKIKGGEINSKKKRKHSNDYDREKGLSRCAISGNMPGVIGCRHAQLATQKRICMG